jgi:hypothetical protein
MVQLIGFMLSSYIITASVDHITRDNTSFPTVICAVATLAVACLCLFGLFTAETATTYFSPS